MKNDSEAVQQAQAVKGIIGDFNAPCIDWESMFLSINRTHVTTHSALIDVMLEHEFEEILNQPTQHQSQAIQPCFQLFFLAKQYTKLNN